MFSSLALEIASLIHIALQAYFWVIIARALLSWVNPDPFNPIVRFLYRVTEPVLRPIRRRLPTYQMGLDLSPLVVILVIEIIDRYIVPQIAALAY
ncbi:MAG: YggT family protein [Candidatus Rokuibacteriota bacterium]|nr:MAG: YggT family protein [Candidatus Rokubacteria bacterium]